jgi:hypothetical protein
MRVQNVCSYMHVKFKTKIRKYVTWLLMTNCTVHNIRSRHVEYNKIQFYLFYVVIYMGIFCWKFAWVGMKVICEHELFQFSWNIWIPFYEFLKIGCAYPQVLPPIFSHVRPMFKPVFALCGKILSPPLHSPPYEILNASVDRLQNPKSS